MILAFIKSQAFRVRFELLIPKMFRPYAASERRTSGRFTVKAMSVFAAPEGVRRPCSQSCNVRTDTPSRAANCDWDGPDFSRAVVTFGRVTLEEQGQACVIALQRNGAGGGRMAISQTRITTATGG